MGKLVHLALLTVILVLIYQLALFAQPIIIFIAMNVLHLAREVLSKMMLQKFVNNVMQVAILVLDKVIIIV